VAMTTALVESEQVNIIVYNSNVRNRAKDLLAQAGVSLAKVNFLVQKTDDVWIRDDGPIFVLKDGCSVEALDFGFNGWGYKARYRKDNQVPSAVAKYLGMDVVDLTDVTLEGGGIEVDGRGTLMATRSSVLENGRNPAMTETRMESVMREYMGAERVIWLDGADGGGEDITDYHVDGFARFGNTRTIVTMNERDLREWGISEKDAGTLFEATDADGVPYDFVYLPLTEKNVVTTGGEDLGFRGSYANFYTANTVVLVPGYSDPNDAVARLKLQELYPDRTVISVDSRNLVKYGGMIHCVTKQQIASKVS